MDSLPKRPNTPPSPPRRGSRHVSPPTAQRPGPSSWEPPRPRSPGVWDRDRGRPMYRPRSRSRSRSYDYNYDFPRRRTPPPPPPHPHSRLPRRAWERSRSRSPPQQPKSSVPCKYFSRPTGCDKGNRCRFRHEAPRSRSFTRSRSRSRSPPRSPRSRSPALRYRADSPMLVPRGGMRSSPPSLLQRLGPVALMRPVSPMRGRAVSNDPNEPLEEGEERSPEQRVGKPNPRVKRRPDPKGNWDSFVADEDEEMSEYEKRDSKPGFDLHRDHSRSRSRSPQPRTRSLSKSRSRSPRNTAATTTRSNSQEKRSHHPPPPRSRSHSRSPHTARSPTRSRDRSPLRGRSRTRSRSRSSSRPPRSRSRSPYRQSHRTRDREPWTERDRKSSTPAPNPSATVINTAAPLIPTGPRLRTGVNPQSMPTALARGMPTLGRGGAPPTGPRGDREPPRGPRNMVGLNAGPPPSAPGMNSGPGWDRPQLAFQSYLAAVQSKLDERQGKRKDEDTADDEPNIADPATAGVKGEPDAMDLDAPEEHGTGRSYSNTPAPGPSIGGSRVASPAHPYVRQSSTSLHASPLVGQGVSLPASSGPGLPHTAQLSQFPQSHPLPLPPRPRSPPRGPRATRGLPEKPKAVGPEPGREGGVERDRGADIIDRGRNRNDWGDKGRASGEPERKGHILGTNLAQQIRAPAPRATTRNSLFPELEKELAALEEQRMRLANEHFPLEVALRQAVDELALSTIEYRAAEDRRIMTETVLEAMVKGGGLAASGDI